MDDIQLMDISTFISSFELSEKLRNSCFLITGATGLIGSRLVCCLASLKKNIRIVAPVRSLEKAKAILGKFAEYIELFECDLLSFDYESICDVDFIIHCAAPTSSKYFIEYPVETFSFIHDGTKILLEYARKHDIKGFVYLSSLEVYGECLDGSLKIKENYQGYIDPLSVRSSYPIAKRATENLCALYAKEYGVPTKIARLTQTTGAGIAKNDNRIIAQFARLAAQGNDIVLHTKGESARPYCYTMDCVSAILYILLKGVSCEAYNVANEDTYISAFSMAEFLRDNFNKSINVRVELNDKMGYSPCTKLNLSTDKLVELGWTPKFGLYEIFNRLITYLKR